MKAELYSAVSTSILALTAFAGTVSTDRSGVTMARSGREVTKADAQCFATSCLGVNERLAFKDGWNANGGGSWGATTNALAAYAPAGCVKSHTIYLYPVHGGDPTRLVPLEMRDAFRRDVKDCLTNSYHRNDYTYSVLGLADNPSLVYTASGSSFASFGIRPSCCRLGGWAFGNHPGLEYDSGYYTAGDYFDDVMDYVFCRDSNPFDLSWTNTTLTAMALNGWNCTYPEMLTNATTRCMHEDWRWALVSAFAPHQYIWTSYHKPPTAFQSYDREFTRRCYVDFYASREGDTLVVSTVPHSDSCSATTNITLQSFFESSLAWNEAELSPMQFSTSSTPTWYVWYWIGGDSDYDTPPSKPVDSASGMLLTFVKANPYLRDSSGNRVSAVYNNNMAMTWITHRDAIATNPNAETVSFGYDQPTTLSVYYAIRYTNEVSNTTHTVNNFASPRVRTVAAGKGWNEAYEQSYVTDAFSSELAAIAENREWNPDYDMSEPPSSEWLRCEPRLVMAVAYRVEDDVTNRVGFVSIEGLEDPYSLTNAASITTHTHATDVVSGAGNGWSSPGHCVKIPSPEMVQDGHDYSTHSTGTYDFKAYVFGCWSGWAKNVKWVED